MKHHRGINQCHIASDKIIEVRSNGMEVRCNGMEVRSNGMEVRSNGMEVRSNGMIVRSNGRKVRSNGRKVRSNGTRIRSNGMQVAIRLHFCPECPSIENVGWGTLHELLHAAKKETLRRGHFMTSYTSSKYYGLTCTHDNIVPRALRALGTKISKTIGVIARLRHFVPTSTLLTLYRSLLSPYILYGLTVWGQAPQIYLIKFLFYKSVLYALSTLHHIDLLLSLFLFPPVVSQSASFILKQCRF